MDNAVEIRGLGKSFDGFSFEDVSLDIPKGSVVGLIGENGAGKTTLIKCITGAVIPDAGSIELRLRNGRSGIGVVFDECRFPEIFTAGQLNSVMPDILNGWDRSRFASMIEAYGIDPDAKISAYSRGMRMKVQVAAALAHDPELLIMDEPTAGMDPAAREEFLDTVLEFMQDEDHTALVSSHITSDLERIADYIVFIHKGRVVLSGEKDALLERFGIARCGKDAEIREKDLVVSTRRGEFGTSMLVDGREEFRKANPDIVVDDASLEDIMVYVIRGDSQ